MSYRVVVSPKARTELYNNAVWWAENHSTQQAARWLDGFEAALESLSKNPGMHSYAAENDSITQHELRQMLYGVSNKPTHRAIFEIRGDTVFVHGIRHLARQELTPEDLE